MIRRSGSVTLVAGIEVWPFESLIAPCGPACPTTAVCADDAEVVPLVFFAVTDTRIVLPLSADCTVYVWFVAPLIAAQLLPCASQPCHWYVNVGVVSLVHVPFSAVSVCPM